MDAAALVDGSAVGTEMDWSDEVFFHDLRNHLGQRQTPANCSFAKTEDRNSQRPGASEMKLR